jgi:O-succinylbenzoate synthase
MPLALRPVPHPAVSAVELWWCPRLLATPHRTSYGVEHRRPTILVRVQAGPWEGWGECAALATPSYRAEHAQAAWWALRHWLAPRLLGLPVPPVATLADLRRVSADLHRRLAGVVGAAMAKAALEAALLDAGTRAAGGPLVALLAPDPRPVPAGAVVGLPSDIPAALRAVEAALAQGATRVKVKVAPGCDHRPLGELRRHFPDAPLAADANGAYRRDDWDTLLALDEFGLLFLEQPLPADDLVGHRRLAAELHTPICLDESLRDVGDVRTAAALEAADLVCLKPPCLGGIGPTLDAIDQASAEGLGWWVGGMLQGTAGRLLDAAVATLPGSAGPAELGSPNGGLRGPDPFGPLSWEGFALRPFPGPGAVPRPDLELVEALATRHWRTPGAH